MLRGTYLTLACAAPAVQGWSLSLMCFGIVSICELCGRPLSPRISRSRKTSRNFKDSDIEEDFLEGVNVKAFTFSLPQYSLVDGVVI
ncbi:hypothetical protein CRG98_022247 [Punica granatum]|uniref:Uncharacterized protein n=1 Tax=Punica granatum TaxID=22663 RepID=A0A2I0JM91_PUNGR|nr:hypothetical protein CRG98_022247 [Punica granatum]